MKLSLTPALWLGGFGVYLLVCTLFLLPLGEGFHTLPLPAALMSLFAASMCFSFADRKGALTSTVPEFILIFALGILVLFVSEFLFGYLFHQGVDALFMSVALMTTTHAEIAVDLGNIPRSQHLLRAGSQIFGALWIIHFSIVAVPSSLLLAAQPRQQQHRKHAQRVTAHLTATSRNINFVFASLVVLASGAYWFTGLTKLDAIALAAATVSLGGFLPYDGSVSSFPNGTIAVAILVMILSACNYARYLQCIRARRVDLFWRSREIRAFLGFMMVFVVITLAAQYEFMDSTGQVLRVVFTIVSIATTTGLAAEAHEFWGPIVILIFIMSLVGGCSGSPSGGFRVSRAISLFFLFVRQFRWDLQASGTGAVRMPQSAIELLPLLLLLWLVSAGLGTLALTFSGLDAITAMSGAVSCLTNTGPGLGTEIGPAGTYSNLNDLAKWALIILMLVGRLEFGVVLVFLTNSYWTVRNLSRPEPEPKPQDAI